MLRPHPLVLATALTKMEKDTLNGKHVTMEVYCIDVQFTTNFLAALLGLVCMYHCQRYLLETM